MQTYVILPQDQAHININIFFYFTYSFYNLFHRIMYLDDHEIEQSLIYLYYY